MTFLEVLLNILAIIGIVAIGGFIIYFLGGLVLSILDSRKKQEPEETATTFVVNQTAIAPVEEEKDLSQEQSYEDTLTDEKFMLDDEKVEEVDYSKATEEKKSLSENKAAEENFDTMFNEDKDFNFDDFDFDAFFNEQNSVEEKPAEPVSAVEETSAAEVKQDVVVEEPLYAQEVYTQPQTIAETNNIVTENKVETVYVQNTELEESLRSEIALLKAELEEQKRLYEALKAQAEDNQKKWEEEKSELENLYKEAEKREEENSSKSRESLSIEEYEARLALLTERLKVNENELRANRKEFLPLKRVRKNLDKDKSKLRRREALVAKQKVLLYGVNNMAEINPEKAKKLAEDLDLLDGLKVSVRHCEEVMEANKDRYPILETANRILVTTNEELKADILACQIAIRRLKGESVDAASLEQMALEQPKRKRGRPRKTETVQPAPVAVVASEDVNVQEIMQSIAADETIVHTAQTETQRQDVPNPDLSKVMDAVVVEEVKAPTQQTVVSVKKEETTTITQTKTADGTASTTQTTKTTHQFDFDAEEPSIEDLFAIENEDLFDFDSDNNSKF